MLETLRGLIMGLWDRVESIPNYTALILGYHYCNNRVQYRRKNLEILLSSMLISGSTNN